MLARETAELCARAVERERLGRHGDAEAGQRDALREGLLERHEPARLREKRGEGRAREGEEGALSLSASSALRELRPRPRPSGARAARARERERESPARLLVDARVRGGEAVRAEVQRRVGDREADLRERERERGRGWYYWYS